jgi:SAM-dependent methyltransferase
MPSIRSRWKAAAQLVAESRDLLDGRPGSSADPPAALVSRDWVSFLLSLDEGELATIETHGHARWPDRTPPGLRSLLERAADVCTLPTFSSPDVRTARRGETPRKRAQVDAFGELVLPLAAHAARVVDVGSGHGHLTREIARRTRLPVVGFDRDASLVGRARRLSSGASPTFAVSDVLRDGLTLSAGDCVIGLHACGELGDLMVASVARSPGTMLALVGCCLQKRRQGSRRPLCGDGPDGSLDLPRGLLGLSNLAASDEGVEASRVDNLAARERRLALNRLLSEGGEPLRLGAELAGLNRRAAQGDLSHLVERAFELRGRPTPPRTAIDEAASWARREHSRARRLSLPRAMLARVLEVYVLLDRASYLEEHGFAVEVGALFPMTVSARNLALVARQDTDSSASSFSIASHSASHRSSCEVSSASSRSSDLTSSPGVRWKKPGSA